MAEMSSIEERRVEAYLTPLRRLTPVTSANRVRRRRGLGVAVVLVVVLAGLSIGAVAVARETFATHATPERAPASLGAGLTCSKLIGMDARRAAALLAARGERLSWRLNRYVDPAQNGGVIGYADAVDSPPAGTVVEDVANAKGGGLVVSIRKLGDPNAPPLGPPRC